MEFEEGEKVTTRHRAETDAASPLLPFDHPARGSKEPGKNQAFLDFDLHLPSLLKGSGQLAFSKLLDLHKIQPKHRANMIDWIIEVMNVFEQTQATLFRSILILDNYFEQNQRSLSLEELHIVGATAMMMASKFEAVVPIRMEHFESKICKGKYSKDELLAQELRVFSTLKYCLRGPSLYELVVSCLGLVKNLDPQLAFFLKNSALMIALMTIFSVDIMKKFTYSEISVCSVLIALKMAESLGFSDPEEKVKNLIVTKFEVNSKFLNQKLLIIHGFVTDFETILPYVQNFKRFYSFDTSGKN